MFNRRSATIYHILGSLTALSAVALFGVMFERIFEWSDFLRWESFCRKLFGEMGSVGFFYVYWIGFLSGFLLIWILDFPRRLGPWAWIVLVAQYPVAVASLSLVTGPLKFPLGLGGYVDPLVEGAVLHCLLFAAATLVLGGRAVTRS